jgi:hypothetical protein
MIIVGVLGLLIGSMCGCMGMALFSVSAYEKGFEDGKSDKYELDLPAEWVLVKK